ncbi:hypothetical protein KO317_03785 [Candidatus Micrarchaeota archaeon]|nr:hypothetical protein [Candidatus Micrarchaeota archaeon]
MQIIGIPKKRVKYLKENIKLLESDLLVSIRFKEDLIEIEGEEFQEYIAKKIVHAIGQGFNVSTSLNLIDEENVMKIIELGEFLPERVIQRQIGRIVGEKGKFKKIIEEEGKVYINIQDEDVSIIGQFEDVEIAVNAIQKLIGGTPHSNVRKYLCDAQAKKSGRL